MRERMACRLQGCRLLAGLVLLIRVNGAPKAGVTKKTFKVEHGGVTTVNSSLAIEKDGSIAAYLKNLKCDPENTGHVQVVFSLNVTRIPCALPMDSTVDYVQHGEINYGANGNTIIHNCSRTETEPLNVTVLFAGVQRRESQSGKDRPPTVAPCSSKPIVGKSRGANSLTQQIAAGVEFSSLLGYVRETLTKYDSPPLMKGKVYNVTLVSMYTVELGVSVCGDVSLQGEVIVEMKNKYGYLSAVDHPLWQLYAGMVVIYCFYTLAWIILMAKYRKDLIRIQYWIAAVIGLALVESCVYFSTYNTMNNTGLSTDLLIIAELLLCLKRTFAVIVLVIASNGFGIVKPRLGPLLTKVLLLGIVYFTLCATEGYLDATTTGHIYTPGDMIVKFLLFLVDFGIFWWVVWSLSATMRALRVRQNAIKLSLYRHFTAAVLVSAAVSVIFIAWSTFTFVFGGCVKDFHEVWLDDGFWSILFCFLLLAMMIFWRPSSNAARYSYTPVNDIDTEEMEQLPSDAFEGMRLRSVKSADEEDPFLFDTDEEGQVEKHIATGGVEGALSSLIDSDEVMMTTKFEVSNLD